MRKAEHKMGRLASGAQIKAAVPFYLSFFLVLMCLPAAAWTADSGSKKNVQKVGGLLFDVDEGVKIEQGSGGSVYMKSNREYMQNKFESIESRFSELESRVQKLEKQMSEAKKSGKPGSEEAIQNSDGRKVWVG